jgi:hypothetical protein
MGTTVGRTLPDVSYRTGEGEQFQAATSLTVVHCHTCGMPYAIPTPLYNSALRYHGDRPNGWQLVCPIGHVWFYTGETRLEKARREAKEARDLAARRTAEKDQIQASLTATKGHVTRQKKKLARVEAGVCPCCKRTFQNLARHMQSKHPNGIPS